MRYQIVYKQGTKDLEERVADLLSVGWRLHGQPFVKDHLLCQAMTFGEYIRPSRLKKGKKDESD